MKSIKYACALVALALAGQAQASRYGFCDFRWSGSVYLTGIIEIDEGEDQDALFAADYGREGTFRSGFLDYIHANVPGTTNYGISYVQCDSFSDLETAQRMVSSYEDQWKDARGEKPVETGWLGGHPTAIDRHEAKPRYKEGDVLLTAPGQKVGDAPQQATAPRAKKPWEIEYERKLAEYQRKLDERQAAIEEGKRLEAERRARLAEMARKAAEAKAEWERRVAACKAGDWSQCNQATPQ